MDTSLHTEKCNLFVLFKWFIEGFLGHVKRIGFDAICVCPLIDHGQQPMKMHTEVTLLYKYKYTVIAH